MKQKLEEELKDEATNVLDAEKKHKGRDSSISCTYFTERASMM
jgi:hypothetical protein